MKNGNLQVAVIGCGRVSGHHCRSIQNNKGIQLAAVCDLVEEKAAKYGKEFNVPYFLNYHEMIRSIPEIDVVAIITPSGMHHEHANEILAYRKHIIVEKPTFMRPSQLVDTFRRADEAGVRVFPVFQNRYNRAVQRVRTALQNGELGAIRIIAVRVRWCRPQRYYDLSPWRGTYAQDGGCLTNQGIHHVDLLRNLGGEVARVNASMRTLGAQIEVEDAVVASLQYRGNSLGVLEVTTAARPDDFEASISFVCEKGLAQIGGIAVNELQIFTPDPSARAQWSEDFSGNVYGFGHQAMYGDISRDLHGGAKYPVTATDALKSLQLLHAFYRSDEKGTWVDVESDEESTRLGRYDAQLADMYRTPAPAKV